MYVHLNKSLPMYMYHTFIDTYIFKTIQLPYVPSTYLFIFILKSIYYAIKEVRHKLKIKSKLTNNFIE